MWCTVVTLPLTPIWILRCKNWRRCTVPALLSSTKASLHTRLHHFKDSLDLNMSKSIVLEIVTQCLTNCSCIIRCRVKLEVFSCFGWLVEQTVGYLPSWLSWHVPEQCNAKQHQTRRSVWSIYRFDSLECPWLKAMFLCRV